MKLEGKVHSAVVDHAEVEATVNGKKRNVLAEVLTVEIVIDGKGKTFHFDDVEAAQEIFKPGKKVGITFAGVK